MILEKFCLVFSEIVILYEDIRNSVDKERFLF